MQNPFSRENIEWPVRLLRGRPLARWGTYLLIAAIALYATLPQAVLEGGLEAFGIKLNIVETPLLVFERKSRWDTDQDGVDEIR